MSEDWSKDIFREEAEELLAELETTLLELESHTDDANLVNRVFRALHTIKGSGAMFGFDEIADFAHDVEALFDRIRSGELVVTHDVLNVSFKARDHIKSLLAESLSDGQKKAATSSLRQEIVAAANGASPRPEAVLPATEEAQEEEEDFVLLEGSLDEEEDQDEPAAHRCRYTIGIKPRAGILPPGYPLEPLFKELEHLGEVQVVHEVPSEGQERWEVTVVTDRDEDEVRDVFFFADVDLDISIVCGIAVEQEQPSAMSQEVPAPDAGDDTPSVEPVIEPPAPVDHKPPIVADPPAAVVTEQQDSPAEAPLPEQASSLRVAASKLDKLVDLVGELVIIQSQLSQQATERADPPLIQLSESLDRLVEELRDTTLGVRMIPIGTTFSKFRRLVRDLGEELGKEVDFVPLGAATELDKTVIERLSDPLVHLLRNAMDHGIESPEERLAAGKPEVGTIKLSAEHSGATVLIRMTDNGRGIDPEVVRRRAIEKGLLTAEEEVSERNLFRMLFAPGFSTATTVTNLSGRGVGLDVVMQSIESLRGSIVIDSEPGLGTTFTIRLPLTLAIIDGLQVRTEDEVYVIPLGQVQECVELTEASRRERDGSRLLDLRGETVPYINLREWFEIPGMRPAIEQVIIATVDKTRVGIVVDDVVGEYQTVIKTLGRIYRHVEGISGATVRGDGSISLILDIPGLVRSVTEQGRQAHYDR